MHGSHHKNVATGKLYWRFVFNEAHQHLHSTGMMGIMPTSHMYYTWTTTSPTTASTRTYMYTNDKGRTPSPPTPWHPPKSQISYPLHHPHATLSLPSPITLYRLINLPIILINQTQRHVCTKHAHNMHVYCTAGIYWRSGQGNIPPYACGCDDIIKLILVLRP